MRADRARFNINLAARLTARRDTARLTDCGTGSLTTSLEF
jgi:hypothetical protein